MSGSIGTACSGMRPSVASSKKCSIPAGEKISNTLVGSVPGFEGWWTTPLGITTNEPAGAEILRPPTRARSGPPRGRRRSPHDRGGGGERTMRARRDDVVVDRIGAVRILVTDLDNHPSSYRILDDFTFVRTNGESSVSRHHVFAPFYRSNVGQAHSMIRLSRSLPA
jgi:hypothetical protein